MNFLLRVMLNRRGVIVFGICRFYNKIVGCRNVEVCLYLYVCLYVVEICRYYLFCKFLYNLLDR